MKEKLLKFIQKANQVIFFIAAIAIAATVGFYQLEKVFRQRAPEPGVIIVDQNTPSKNEPTIEPHEVVFGAKVKEIYIFKLTRGYVLRNKEGEMLNMFNKFGDKSNNRHTVNFIFVSQTGGSHKLFDNDGYIISHDYAYFEEDKDAVVFGKHEYNRGNKKIPINLFLVVGSDSNQDGFLSEDDKKTLYRSAYSGHDIEKISDSVESYHILDRNLLLIEQDNGGYFEYKIDEGVLNKLNTGNR